MLLLVCGLLILVGVHLFRVPLANLWIFSLVVYGFAWVLAVALATAAVVLLWLRRGAKAAVPLLVVGVLAGVAVTVVDWTPVFANGYYRFNRGDFAAVAALARAGNLTDAGYYGDTLPPGLRHLSVNERAARIGSFDGGRQAAFLPAFTGIPDGAAGFAFIEGAPGATRFDCFGDPCRARWSLGDGWYWLQPG